MASLRRPTSGVTRCGPGRAASRASRPTSAASARPTSPACGSAGAARPDDVVSFLDALGIERPTLVGHDWGGIIAFKVAIDQPERVTRLALLDTLCTVWSPRAVHGCWFKAEAWPRSSSPGTTAVHRGDVRRRGRRRSARAAALALAGPAGPGPARPGSDRRRPRPLHERLRDPDAWSHAIQYYRYGLPFHIVTEDASPHGERYASCRETQVAEMWLHGGASSRTRGREPMDYGPEDRRKRLEPDAVDVRHEPARAPARQGRAEIPTGQPLLRRSSPAASTTWGPARWPPGTSWARRRRPMSTRP